MGVLEVQQFLVKFGFDPGPLDGVMGPKTTAAIRAFQQFAGAPVTGIIDATLEGYLGEWDTNERTRESEEARATGATTGTEDTQGAEIDLPTQRTPTTDIGGQTVPFGMRLIAISNPAGSDAALTYYLIGDVFGAEVAYSIGDLNDLNATFGGLDNFGDFSTWTQKEFDNRGLEVVGSVDEIIGTSESLQAQFERDMRAAGLENPPAWLAGDKTAMAVYVTAVNEGWSAERTWGSLSKTDAFQSRFDGLDVVMAQLGTTSFVSGISEFVARETEIRQSILANRGPQANTSPEYVASLIGAGWQASEVSELLSLEKRVRDNPEALDNINAILSFQGLGELSPDDFISFLQEQDAALIDPSVQPSELFEGINDALRFQALIDEGLNISLEFATELGEGFSDDIGTVSRYSAQAQMAAMEVARNADDLTLQRYDLTRDDVIAVQFNEESPTGKSVSDINDIMSRLGRERSKAATGFASTSSYIDALGRLRVQGMSTL